MQAPQKTYTGLDSSPVLQAVPGKPEALVYKKMDVDAKTYTKFMIDPVTIYSGQDAEFHNVSPEDKKKIADFIRDEFMRVLKNDYEIVQQPDSHVLRLKFTLAGLELPRPVIATVTHVIPFGLALNLGKSPRLDIIK